MIEQGIGTVQENSALEYYSGSVGQNSMGKDDFLKLLVAQLRNQDPMKPMEDREFIAQLAQFNALEQMQNLNNSFSQLLKWQQLLQSSALIGKNIEAIQDDGSFVTGVVTEVKITSEGPVLKVDDRYISLGNISRIF